MARQTRAMASPVDPGRDTTSGHNVLIRMARVQATTSKEEEAPCTTYSTNYHRCRIVLVSVCFTMQEWFGWGGSQPWASSSWPQASGKSGTRWLRVSGRLLNDQHTVLIESPGEAKLFSYCPGATGHASVSQAAKVSAQCSIQGESGALAPYEVAGLE